MNCKLAIVGCVMVFIQKYEDIAFYLTLRYHIKSRFQQSTFLKNFSGTTLSERKHIFINENIDQLEAREGLGEHGETSKLADRLVTK